MTTQSAKGTIAVPLAYGKEQVYASKGYRYINIQDRELKVP